MPLDYEIFEQALTLFHRYSLQNSEAVRQMQHQGVLPRVRRSGFCILDLGAGQGHLPRLMQNYADTLVLLEPNPRCVEVLQHGFPNLYPCRWDASARERLHGDWPRGFDLITMSHMLYHFNGLDDIRAKIRMALSLLAPGGHLVIVINQPGAPMALIGIAFELAQGRLEESATNQDLHRCCHAPGFYQELAGRHAVVAIHPIDAPLRQVESRGDLIVLLRMCLLNPLSCAPCTTASLDRFIADYLDSCFPALRYPATIPSQDDLITIRRTGP